MGVSIYSLYLPTRLPMRATYAPLLDTPLPSAPSPSSKRFPPTHLPLRASHPLLRLTLQHTSMV